MKLGADGIDAYLFDEYMIQMDWLYSDAMGGVRLVVSDEMAESALKLLRSAEEEEGLICRPVRNVLRPTQNWMHCLANLHLFRSFSCRHQCTVLAVNIVVPIAKRRGLPEAIMVEATNLRARRISTWEFSS